MSVRPIIGQYGAPVQESITQDPEHLSHLQMNRPVLGIVWEVRPADSPYNRYTRNKASRGAFPVCSVLVLNDGVKCNYFLDHVIIPAGCPSGLDDYEEHLPRPSTKRVTGEILQPKLLGIDPYELDGDWCIVSFIGGNLDLPYISNWWRHPKNTYDPATSGRGNPTRDGRGRALIQDGRVFRRVNGVEQVVTSVGDVYLSTKWANSMLQMGQEHATEGRWPRQQRDEGGSIFVEVKPSQSFEMTWRVQPEGIGIRQGRDNELPQTNPVRTTGQNVQQTSNMYVYVDKDKLKVVGSDLKLSASSKITLECDDKIQINADGAIDVSADSATISVNSTLDLGGTGGNTLIDSRWKTAWDSAMASSPLTLPTGSTAQNAAAIAAIQTMLTALYTALSSSITEKTKAV